MSRSELSIYEREREKQMAANWAKLVELGIESQKTSIREAIADKRKAKQQNYAAARRQRIEVDQSLPARRSDRVAGKEVQYTYNDLYKFEETPFHRPVRKRSIPKNSPLLTEGKYIEDGRTGTRTALSYWPLGYNNTRWPPSESVEKVLQLAEEASEASSFCTGIKVMLPSHVAGGFWLQLPVEFSVSLPQEQGKHHMRLKDQDGKESDVVWLRRAATGGGLSGGWRGFAIEHRLAVGDVVLFEKIQGPVIQIIIFYARGGPGCIDSESSESEHPEATSDSEPSKKKVKSNPCDSEQSETQSESEEYEIGSILRHRKEDGEVLYLTTWKGYKDQTWQDRASFMSADGVPQILADYEAAHGLTPENEPPSSQQVGKDCESDSESEDAYEIEGIVKHKKWRGKVKYLTTWVGYSDQTWQDRDSFLLDGAVPEILREYELTHGLTP